MRLRTIGARFDSGVGELAERASRRVTRRQAVRTMLVGGATGVASLSVGVSVAEASCASNCGPTKRCNSCPEYSCPSGYSLCKGSSTGNCFNKQGYRCEWPSGYWLACNKLCRGYGYQNCLDCIGPGGCANWCTCLTATSCCGCSTASDVVAEQYRIQHLIAAN